MEVYIDNAATTKPRKEVIEAMLISLTDLYGNPSSLHRKGLEAEKEIKKIRNIIAKALGCKEQEIIYTSGGTESNNLAVRGIAEANKRKGNHIITSRIEHPSVLSVFNDLEKKGCNVTYLDIDENGFIYLEQVEQAVTDSTVLVSLMHVNNEIGSIQPIESVARIIKNKNPDTVFHVDAVQSFGKIKLNLNELKNVDSLSISGHKFHGPKGIGVLYINKNIRIAPIFTGGNQEYSLRAGTENVPGIFGLGEAVKLTMEELEENCDKMNELKAYFIHLLENELEDIEIQSKTGVGYAPHIINVSLTGLKSEIMLHCLEQDGIYISSGSACSSRKKGYSHVLKAMKLKESFIESSVRLSLSYTNTKEEIDYAVERMKYHIKSLRKVVKR